MAETSNDMTNRIPPRYKPGKADEWFMPERNELVPIDKFTVGLALALYVMICILLFLLIK